MFAYLFSYFLLNGFKTTATLPDNSAMRFSIAAMRPFKLPITGLYNLF
jgi:hypothetical protein